MSIPLRTRTLPEARSFAPPTAARTRCENYATQRYRSHGTIENSLIQYDRPDGQAPKQARVRLLEVGPDRALDEARAALHRDVVVTKQRHSLWRDNVKFHVDEVPRARFLPRDRGHRQGRDPAGRPGSRTTIPCEKTINSHASYHGSVA